MEGRGAPCTVLILTVVIFIHITMAMDLCEHEEKFPQSNNSCYNKQDQLSRCPINKVYGNCSSCQRSCEDPSTCRNTCMEGQSEGCICPEKYYMKGGSCVLAKECGCYLQEEQTIVPEGETFIKADCTRIAACSNGQLTRNELLECSPDAVCEERNGERGCYCREGFTGNGTTCNSAGPPPTDCMDVYSNVSTSSGVYTIKPTNWPGDAFSVYCNMSHGGGWTVFQRRFDGSVDFFLEWQDYKDGFGNISGEHWLGNDKLHYLTNQKRYGVRVDLVKRQDHGQYYGEYDFFRIENEDALYNLTGLGTFSWDEVWCGIKGHFLLLHSHNRPFSTKDRDNGDSNANNRYSAWWYGDNCYTLNGRYPDYFALNCVPGHKLYFSEMKLRPV